MRIVVLVKEVPDTWGERQLDLATGILDRRASAPVIDEIGERALEVALRAKDADKSVEVVVLTMGPASAKDVLRKGLAMGADSAIHIVDDRLSGSDLRWTAKTLAAAINRGGFDLVVAGNESTDGGSGAIPAMLAEFLGMPHLTFLSSATIAGGEVRGTRGTEYGTFDAHCPLPAVISITERAADPRFPNFKGIMSAKRKRIESVSLGDLRLEEWPAFAGGRTVIVSTSQRPPRAGGIKVVDDGTTADRLADFLLSGRLI